MTKMGQIAAAILMLFPVLAVAQSDDLGVSRAQVQAELARLVQVGFDPNRRAYYPAEIQAAERLVHAKTQASTDVAFNHHTIELDRSATPTR